MPRPKLCIARSRPTWALPIHSEAGPTSYPSPGSSRKPWTSMPRPNPSFVRSRTTWASPTPSEARPTSYPAPGSSRKLWTSMPRPNPSFARSRTTWALQTHSEAEFFFIWILMITLKYCLSYSKPSISMNLNRNLGALLSPVPCSPDSVHNSKIRRTRPQL